MRRLPGEVRALSPRGPRTVAGLDLHSFAGGERCAFRWRRAIRAFCATMTRGETRAAEKRALLREPGCGRLRLLASAKTGLQFVDV